LIDNIGSKTPNTSAVNNFGVLNNVGKVDNQKNGNSQQSR